MDYIDDPGGRGLVVAVIGGGASGTLATIHMLRCAAWERVPLRVALIDRDGRHGQGQAYSTTNPAHLLNSHARQMSAMAGDPSHLLRWAEASGITHDGYLPRYVYGRYLRETLAEAEQAARPTARVSRLTSRVVALRRNSAGRPLRLHLAADGRIDADVVVLATGQLPPAPPCHIPRTPRYIADPWAPGALERLWDGRPVAVIGTGLTMLDVAMTVTGASPRAHVLALSRHGLLPQPERSHPPSAGAAWLPAFADPRGPVGLADLMWQIRTAVGGRPGAWEEVMDSLRPQVPGLWRRLSLADQRTFLRLAARYWESHRHRMPPATVRRVTELRSTGRLSVVRGQLESVAEERLGLRLRIGQEGSSTELTAGWLVNASGPSTNVTATTDPLLRDLLAGGLARPDNLRLGLDADNDGAVLDTVGTPVGGLFTLGPPLRGHWYETTAVPEIRDQAAALARRVVSTRRVRAWSGSAA